MQITVFVSPAKHSSTQRLIESNTHIEVGTRESYPSVQDLQSTTRLAESWILQIFYTRMGFLSPSLNVVIDYFFSFLSKNWQNMSKTHTRRDFSRLFGVDVL